MQHLLEKRLVRNIMKIMQPAMIYVLTESPPSLLAIMSGVYECSPQMKCLQALIGLQLL